MDTQTGVSDPPPRRHAGPHPTIFDPLTLTLIAVLCVIGAIIGMQLLVTLGVTANTSIVGALIAMALARVKLRAFARFRSIHVQNLAQSAISAATFGAGNSLLLPIGIPFLMGRADLVLPLLGGVALAMLVDATMLYRLFGSRAFPAEGAWPPGVAAAEAIRAGDAGGRRVLQCLGPGDVRHRAAAARLLIAAVLRPVGGRRYCQSLYPAWADDRCGGRGAGAGRPGDDG
jgi:uncharacterized oligopeptide transporter (OPT) family protein